MNGTTPHGSAFFPGALPSAFIHSFSLVLSSCGAPLPKFSTVSKWCSRRAQSSCPRETDGLAGWGVGEERPSHSRPRLLGDGVGETLPGTRVGEQWRPVAYPLSRTNGLVLFCSRTLVLNPVLSLASTGDPLGAWTPRDQSHSLIWGLDIKTNFMVIEEQVDPVRCPSCPSVASLVAQLGPWWLRREGLA